MSRPHQRLNSNIIKNALKAYIVPPFCKSYQICAVRAFWQNRDSIWGTRRQLEEILNDDERVVAFFSCITAKQQDQRGNKRKRNEESQWDPFDSNDNSEEEEEERLDSITPGLSFWIVYDCADVCSSVFANVMIKRFVDAKLDLAECKSIRCRGMYFC